MEYLDSITWSGWGKLLRTFIPLNWTFLFVELLVYVGIPLLVLWLLIRIFRNQLKNELQKQSNGPRSVWSKCGATWLTIGMWFFVFNIIWYLLYYKVLTTSVSGLRSVQVQYQEEVLKAPSNKDKKLQIAEIAGRLRNPKRRPTAAKPSSGRAKVTASVSDDERTKHLLDKEVKLTEEAAQKLENDEPLSPKKTPSVRVASSSYSSREYKVVKFFFNGYPWLHHSLYALIWLIVTVCLFAPGYKMQKQKTIKL